MRLIRYRAIADELRRRIADGELSVGRVLPSEAELGRSYAASRVTVRRALEVLRDDGLIDARQGFGWFVRGDPLRQSLGRLATIESQLEASGSRPGRRVLDFGFVAAPPRVRAALGAEVVLEVRRLTLADDEPFARVTVWCPEALGASLSRDAVERATFHEALDIDLGGATQVIAAAPADGADAALLGIPEGSPVLRCERTTRDAEGTPVLFSEHVFAAHRTELVVELPTSQPSIAPSGVRLVDGTAAGPAPGGPAR